MEEAYREKGRSNLMRTGETVMRMRMEMKEEKGGKGRGEKRLTRSDRSANLWTKGRVVQLGQIDLVRLVADIAFDLGDIRSDFNGDVGDGVDGSVGRIS
jgi:hypothetical protein